MSFKDEAEDDGLQWCGGGAYDAQPRQSTNWQRPVRRLHEPAPPHEDKDAKSAKVVDHSSLEGHDNPPDPNDSTIARGSRELPREHPIHGLCMLTAIAEVCRVKCSESTIRLASALVSNGGLSWPKLIHIIDNAPEFNEVTRKENGTLYLPCRGLSIGLIRVRGNLYHAQVMENGVPREATLQSGWPVLFPVEMNRPSIIRTAQVARSLHDAVEECVDVCLPLSQAIKLPENVIIGGLDDDSPRSKDVDAASSADPIISSVAFEVGSMSCAVITDPNDGNPEKCYAPSVMEMIACSKIRKAL